MYCEHCHEIDAGVLPHECIGSLRAELDALQARVNELENKLNPRLWTKEMHDAWHLNLPDTIKAFEALRNLK